MPAIKSFLIILILFCAATASAAIPGDCNDDGKVTIAEVQSAINMNLNSNTTEICVDLDGDGTVTESEVQQVIDAFLGPVSLPTGIVARGAYVVEGDAPLLNVPLTVRLTKSYSAPVSVDWATADATATAGSDYVQASGTLTFAPGELQKTIPLQVIGDTVAESAPRESFKVVFSNPVGAPLATPYTFVTIEEDDRTIIDPQGGIVRIGGGAVTIHALAGALAADTSFSATAAADANPLIVDNAYTILPAATTFTAHTSLSISYDPALLPGAVAAADLVIAWWNGTSWQPLTGSHVNTTAKTVSAGINATGSYAVMDGRNKSLNIAYVVETPEAVNEFTTVAAAVTYVCAQPDKGRVIIRRTPITIGNFSPACDVSLEREPATPVTIDGASTIVSTGPISFSGFVFSAATTFTAGSDLTLRSNQFGSTVDIFLDPSPVAAAASSRASFAAAAADGCTHDGNVEYRDNFSTGRLSLAVIGTAGYCGKAAISDSFMPTLSASATGAAKLMGEARLEVERLNIEDVTVTATAEGNARVFLGEVNTGRMVENLSIPAGISGPRLDSLDVNVNATAEVNLEGGGTLKFSNKGLRVRDEYRFSLLDNTFQGEVHGEIGASEVGKMSADIGGSATLTIADGVSIQGSASYRLNAGLRDGIVASSNTSYSAGVSVDASRLPLNLPINLNITGGSSTDVQGTMGVFGIGIGFPLGTPANLDHGAAPAAPVTPAGLAIDGFKIISSSSDLGALKNGVHIDLENRDDRIEIKNSTYSVGLANAIVVQNALGPVLIQGNTVLAASFGIALENVPGQVTIDANTITANYGIVPGNGVQQTTITGNTIDSDVIGIYLNGSSSSGLRHTTASGNIIRVPAEGLALMLMSSTILDFHSNTVTGVIDVAAPSFIYDAYASVLNNSIQGMLIDFPYSPVLTTDPAGQGLDAETEIITTADWTGNGCADYPPSLDEKIDDVCSGEVGLPPKTAPL